ncbi:6-phosphofructokinase [Acidihalobacter ferrooxydans]|uniref:6-phosphofructokinase n=2 Tax=Acidihalobacter ferrooxydans TaxID=1765967 RepID=A0A1P8UHZ0_9GAMM|nr:6-phosphofructokinase [Acidihalobacter ferrooxydans]
MSTAPARRERTRRIGLLTAGGDCQALNPALRALTLGATITHGWEVYGFKDGYLGLQEGRFMRLMPSHVTNIQGLGGTIIGTGRGQSGAVGSIEEATARCREVYDDLGLSTLICLGGDGTQRFARHLHENAGLNIITLPKTIDNDIRGTDVTFGFDSATQIGAEAIDRLHTTASSHHRVMLVEVMGRDAGWLAAASALAGGADVALVPEIPYQLDKVVAAVNEDVERGRAYSIVVVAEGAMSAERAASGEKVRAHTAVMELIDQLPELTGAEVRLTTLGHVMRGGSPTSADRILATQLGARAIELAVAEIYGVMVAVHGAELTPVPLTEVGGAPRCVPLDHPLLTSLRAVGTALGD